MKVADSFARGLDVPVTLPNESGKSMCYSCLQADRIKIKSKLATHYNVYIFALLEYSSEIYAAYCQYFFGVFRTLSDWKRPVTFKITFKNSFL